MYLRAFVSDYPTRWVHTLPCAEYWYNTSVQSSTGFSRFQVVYGRPPPPLIGYSGEQTLVDSLDNALRDRESLLITLKLNLRRAQDRMRMQANRHRHDKEFNVDD
nr:Retrotransposable element Tf2 [Ipomoea batatas]